ncbi:MAG TPA: Gfo/Idh/MocA family oxidoreductase [Vicinamibacteria bacterium]|nr:Gfo/Idh/MocA family oxidoreductase [Vicinamibacteria bacterium]
MSSPGSGRPVPVAVIGVGALGSRHARLYASLPQAELIGVADTDLVRARSIGQKYGVPATADYRELMSRVRAASVTVPTVAHRQVAVDLMEAGIDVLVEKPMAASAEEAGEMLALAQERNIVLGVGHTERYNPAVEAVIEYCRDPRFIEVHRLASFSPRSLDIDVVLDLMIHDLDVVASLVRSEVRQVEAIGVAVLTERADIANARLRFESGCVANLTASRISQDKMRKLRVWEKDSYVSLDYLDQEAWSYRLVEGEGRPTIVRKRLSVENEEPLKRELEDFLEAVVSRRSPRVSGEDGLKALRLAHRVMAAIAESLPS